jgi:hypothetical protein
MKATKAIPVEKAKVNFGIAVKELNRHCQARDKKLV